MEDMKTKLTAYCAENPVIMYGDYRDELSPEQIDAILEGGADSFWEAEWESEIYMQDSWYEYGFSEYVAEAFTACDIDSDDLDDESREELESLIRENLCFDFSDFWRTACRNSRPMVTLEPINPEDGEPFYCVHPGLDFQENMRRARALFKYFGIRDYRAIANMYEHESLKVCGTLDLWGVLEAGGVPDTFRIHSGDNLIFHTGWNGSGCLGDVRMRKDSTVIKCKVRNDESNRYGVQAVYDFIDRYWREELTPVWPESEKSSAA